MKNTADISRMSICWNRAFDTSMKKLNQMAVTELFHCQNTYIFYFFVTFRPFIKKILTLCPFSRTNTYIFSIFIKNTYTFPFWRRNDTHMPQCQDIFLAAPIRQLLTSPSQKRTTGDPPFGSHSGNDTNVQPPKLSCLLPFLAWEAYSSLSVPYISLCS